MNSCDETEGLYGVRCSNRTVFSSPKTRRYLMTNCCLFETMFFITCLLISRLAILPRAAPESVHEANPIEVALLEEAVY